MEEKGGDWTVEFTCKTLTGEFGPKWFIWSIKLLVLPFESFAFCHFSCELFLLMEKKLTEHYEDSFYFKFQLVAGKVMQGHWTRFSTVLLL